MTDRLRGWTIVFDLDGTLIDSAPDLHAALNHTLSSKGLEPVSLPEIRAMIGDGAKALIRKGLASNSAPIDETEINQILWPCFIDHYVANITRLTRPFETCVETLNTLTGLGARLAVCTNKSQSLAEKVISDLGLRHHFQSIVGGDLLGLQKPDPAHILETVKRAGGSAGRAIMVGDAQTDERAARMAQLPFVFVNFGYGDFDPDPYPARRIISHWRDMMPALQELATPD